MAEEPAMPPEPSAGPAPNAQAATPPAGPIVSASQPGQASPPAPTADDLATPVPPHASPEPAAFADEDDEPFDAVAYADDQDDEPFDAEAYFNPYSGPPEGEDAWLAQVASPVADAYLASRPAPPAAREVLAAGFTHRDHEPGARGFAAGGPLDTMEPGPVLAGFAGDAAGEGLGALNDDALIGVMCAARRLASWSASIELGAVSQLTARRDAHAAATRDSRQTDHVADEVAVALTLTCRAADKLLGLAAGVRRVPAVAAALAAGRIDVPRAMVFCDELAGLADAQTAAVADVTIEDAAGLTTGELRAVLNRAVMAADPAAARKRREKAQKDARVEAWAESRDTAALAGRDLPPADVLAADKRIDAAARSLKTAGAEGTLEQLRAKVFLALLTSHLYTLLPGNGDPGQDGQHPDGQHPDGQRWGPGTDDNGAGEDDSDRGPGPDDNGTGADDDQDGRDQDGRDQDGPGDRNGGGTRRPGPGPGTSPRGGAALPGGPSGLTGLTGSVNLTLPLATWLGLADAPGEAAGYGHLDAGTCRDLATRLTARPGSNWCVTVTGPDGRAAGHGCARAGPPGQRAGPGPPGSDPRAWLAAITISWLETGACGHPKETFAYRPSPALRHLVKTRDRTCSFPGCRRSARRCDDDHTVPYDQGGRTCECNLAALCRRHHATKQAPGWHLEQPRPGTLTWTLPSGRKRTVTPRAYPA